MGRGEVASKNLQKIECARANNSPACADEMDRTAGMLNSCGTPGLNRQLNRERQLQFQRRNERRSQASNANEDAEHRDGGGAPRV